MTLFGNVGRKPYLSIASSAIFLRSGGLLGCIKDEYGATDDEAVGDFISYLSHPKGFTSNYKPDRTIYSDNLLRGGL